MEIAGEEVIVEDEPNINGSLRLSFQSEEEQHADLNISESLPPGQRAPLIVFFNVPLFGHVNPTLDLGE
jgi:hypothetical protein